MKNLFKTIMFVFVVAIFALTLSSCDNKLQNASQNFGAGKNFFESYGIKTEGAYVAGRIVSAESKFIGKLFGLQIKLNNEKEFFMSYSDDFKCSTIFYLNEEEKKFFRDTPNTYDSITIKNLYVEAMVSDGVSYQFVYYDYVNHQSAQNFMKNVAKTKTEKSSLDMKDYRNSKYFGGPKETGSSKVVQIVTYYGIDEFSSFYLSNGKVLTLTSAVMDRLSGPTGKFRKPIKEGDTVSYILSDMNGSNSHDGTDPYTNTLDYVVE